MLGRHAAYDPHSIGILIVCLSLNNITFGIFTCRKTNVDVNNIWIGKQVKLTYIFVFMTGSYNTKQVS